MVVDATGVPEAIRAGVDMVGLGRAASCRSACRPPRSALRVGSFTEKELDVLGVSCAVAGEFAEAVALVERNRDLLAEHITHEYPLERAPEAIAFAIEHPVEVMKVVITGA